MDSETVQVGANVSARTPPYVSFKSFITLLEDFKVTGVPPRIDRSVLKRFSGGLGSQLLVALRSLRLMNDDDTPTPYLQTLVETLGSDDFPKFLRRVLDGAYPFLERIDLKTATPSMFAEAFKDGTNAKEDVLRKCRTFFLHAAKAAQVDIGPRLEKGTYTRSTTGNGRRRKRIITKETEVRQQHEATAPATVYAASLELQLVGKFPEFDPAWPDNIKAAWFEGFSRLMSSVGDIKKGAGTE